MTEAANSRNRAPCKGCPGRVPGCSDHCRKEEFLAWRQERERIREAQDRERELKSYIINEIRKNRRTK